MNDFEIYQAIKNTIGVLGLIGFGLLGSGWAAWKGIGHWTGFAKIWKATKGNRREYRSFCNYRLKVRRRRDRTIRELKKVSAEHS